MTRKSRNWLIFVVAVVFLIGIRVASVHPIASSPFFSADVAQVIALANTDEERRA